MRITQTFTTGIRTELHSRPFFAMRFVLCYPRTSASVEARKGAVRANFLRIDLGFFATVQGIRVCRYFCEQFLVLPVNFLTLLKPT